jgi:hypothetical protein
MSRVVTWIGRNADGLLALAIAAVVAVITWLDIASTEATNGATLLVLAVLAGAILRERSRQRSVEHDVRELTGATTDAHLAVDAKLDEIKTHLDDSKVALENLSMVRTLTGLEVTHALAEARRDTDRWLFKGGTGTYMRARTLPECVANARQARRALVVRIEIVDPHDTEACRRYAEFRRSLPGRSDGEPWTLDRVRKESFATILAGRWWRQRYHLLDVEIGLSSVMTTLRWDLSSSRLIITQEDPGSPALMVERGRFYYDRLEVELRTSHDQARKVPLETVLGTSISEEPTVDETQHFFESLGLALPSTFGERDVQDIVRKVLHPRNPYEDDGRGLHP